MQKKNINLSAFLSVLIIVAVASVQMFGLGLSIDEFGGEDVDAEVTDFSTEINLTAVETLLTGAFISILFTLVIIMALFKIVKRMGDNV